MANSGWTADPNDLTLPPGASTSDPRIYLGPDDPIADSIGQDAAIVFYWGADRAFILSVENSGGAGEHGQLHLWSSAPGDGLTQYIDLDHEVGGEKYATYGQQLDRILMNPGILELIPDVLNTTPNAPQLFIGDFSYQQTAGFPMVDTFYYGRSAGRGQVGEAISTASSGAVSTVETVVLTIPSRTYFAGRAYEITQKAGAQPAAAGVLLHTRVRKTNTAGQDLGEYARTSAPLSGQVMAINAGVGAGVKFRCTSDVTAAIALTATSNAAGTCLHWANAITPREIRAWDIGEAADYSDYPLLV